MTKKHKHGTLSTVGFFAKETKHLKENNVIGKMKQLLGARKIRMSSHANQRMGERNILYFEVLQSLSSGKHDPKRDRFNREFNSWDYSIEGKTVDNRELRIGICFEVDEKTGERLLILTVIDPKQK
jgi:hypothetical protein